MMELLLTRWLHFVGFALWLVGLGGMSLTLMAVGRSRAAGIIADIGFTLALATGIYSAITRSLFTQPWLHIKLTVVAVLVVLHIILRVRTRKQNAAGASTLLAGVLILAAAILYLVVFKPLSS